MVKKVIQQLHKEQIIYEQKLVSKLQQLISSRKKNFLKDQKRAAIKFNKPIRKTAISNLYQFPQNTSKLVFKSTSVISKENQKEKQRQIPIQVKRQVHDYKVALQNVQAVLQGLKQMNIKNQRPDDYLVQMYKSDKQMLKVRRFLAEKENQVKQKMQGKDWASKTKRRQRAKKKSQAKRARKKAKIQAKRPKQKMIKVNGKNKIKK